MAKAKYAVSITDKNGNQVTPLSNPHAVVQAREVSVYSDADLQGITDRAAAQGATVHVRPVND